MTPVPSLHFNPCTCRRHAWNPTCPRHGKREALPRRRIGLNIAAAAILVIVAVFAIVSTARADKNVPLQRERVARIAEAQAGKPYVWGAASPAVGFDCSGLVDYAYHRIGRELGGRVTTWRAVNLGVRASLKSLEPGDMLILDSGGHMGMYLGRGQVIHASSFRGQVVIASLAEMRRRIRQARRVLLET